MCSLSIAVRAKTQGEERVSVFFSDVLVEKSQEVLVL